MFDTSIAPEATSYWAELGQVLRSRGFDELPRTYLVLDIETTGFLPSRDKLLQIGFLLCANDKVLGNSSLFVRQSDDVLNAYDAGSYVQKKIAEGNSGYVKSADVRKYGIDQEHALRAVADAWIRLSTLYPQAVLVGHNLIRFDATWFDEYFKQYGIDLQFPRERMIDTGALVKAGKLKCLPLRGEDLSSFFLRTHNIIAKGVFWRLELAHRELCPAGTVDLSMAHDASADCLMTHQVWQALRNQMETRA